MKQGVKQAAPTSIGVILWGWGGAASTPHSGTAAGFGLSVVHRVCCQAEAAQLSLGLRAKPWPGKLERPYSASESGFFAYQTGITERDRKRICADADHWPGVTCSLSKWDSA